MLLLVYLNASSRVAVRPDNYNRKSLDYQRNKCHRILLETVHPSIINNLGKLIEWPSCGIIEQVHRCSQIMFCQHTAPPLTAFERDNG